MAPKHFTVVLWITFHFLTAVLSEPPEIIDVGLEFTEESNDVTAVKGAPLWLHCAARSTSAEGGPVNITWHKDGAVVNDARHYVLGNGTLFFRRVVHKVSRGRSDAGVYQCVARNQYGVISGRKVHLQISALGRFTNEEVTIEVAVGSLARLQCPIEGLPTPTITWEKNRQGLPQEARYTTLPSGVLQIVDVVSSDAGQYRCKAVNIAKERHSSETELQVTAGSGSRISQLVAGPQDTTIRVSQSTVLECAISYLPQGGAITWTRPDGASLPNSRAAKYGQGNLRIVNAQLSDGGDYVCSDGRLKAQAKLSVLVPPELILTSDSVMKPAASTQRFNCEFSGYPTPTITWTKNGEPVSENSRLRLNHDSTELLIPNLVISDSGLYQCWGENIVGSVSGTIRFFIEPSENAPSPPSNVKAEALDSRSIRVSWESAPSTNGHPTMAYTVHYVCLCSSEMGSKERQMVVIFNEVVVKDLKPYTNYSFYVRAYNNQAASPHSVSVVQATSEDVPTAAPALTVTPQGVTALKLTWSELPPERALGKITRYKIMYRLKDAPSVQVIPIDSAQIHEYLLTDLKPHEEYEVRVLAGTAQGFPAADDRDDRKWPWVSQVTDTQSIGVPEPPVMEAQHMNSTAVQLSWREREPNKAGALETHGFKVSYHKVGENNKAVNRLFDKTVLGHTVTGLEPDTQYELSLLAFNELGDSDATMLSIHTPSLMSGPPPPPPPQPLDAEPINETTIKLSWKTPPFTTSVASYTVKYNLVLAESGREMTNSSLEEYFRTDQTSLIIGGLEPFTVYEFAIRSHTPDSVGGFGLKVRCRTEEGTPGPPTNPQWSLQGPRRVELRWQPPTQKNGVIKSYVILYSDMPDMPEQNWKSKSQNGNSTKALVDELQSNALYYFKLRARTSKGTGPPSRVLEVLTQDIRGPSSDKETQPGSNNNRSEKAPGERMMGIIVGVCIGGGCIIICAIIIVLRNKCFPPRRLPGDHNVSYAQGNGCIGMANGNGCIPESHHQGYHGHNPNLHTSSDFQEMDSFTPMLTQLPENENSDSKGGYVLGYKFANGAHLNGYNITPTNSLRTTYTPNGKVHTYITRSGIDHCNGCSGAEDGAMVPLRCEGEADQLETALHSSPQVYCSLEDIDHSYSADDPSVEERQNSGAPAFNRAGNINYEHGGLHGGATTGSNNSHIVSSGHPTQPNMESFAGEIGQKRGSHHQGTLETGQPRGGQANTVPSANSGMLSFPSPTAVFAGSHSRGSGDGGVLHMPESTGGERQVENADRLRPSPSRSQGSAPSSQQAQGPSPSSTGQSEHSGPLQAPTD